MIKKSTQIQDEKILGLLRQGLAPKDIVRKYRLPGIWTVANAKLRSERDRRRMLRETPDRRSSNMYGQIPIPQPFYDHWITMEDLNPLLFESVGGCYVVYVDKKPFYIGQSKNVQKRMMGHGIRKSHDGEVFYTPWGDKNSVHVKVKYHRRYGEWLACEARLIKRLKPKENFKIAL